MKKLVVSTVFLLATLGAWASQEEIKWHIRSLGYPMVLLIRETKSLPEDDLATVYSSGAHIFSWGFDEDRENINKGLEAIRTLSDAELAELKKEYDESVQREQEMIKEWNSPEAVAARQQAEVEWKEREAQWEKESQLRDAQRAVWQAEAAKPEVLAVINGFVNALDSADVVASAKNLAHQFITEWKTKIDAQQRTKIEQIMTFALRLSEIIQKVNGDMMKLFFGGDDRALQELSREYWIIFGQLRDALLPYEIAMREYLSKEQKSKLENRQPQLIQPIIEEFKRSK